jgi:hypothetical protein
MGQGHYERSLGWIVFLGWIIFLAGLIFGMGISVGHSEIRYAGPQLACNINAIESPSGTVWVIHRTKLVNGIVVEREAIMTTRQRKRAFKACEDYLDGKPVKQGIIIKKELR